MSHLLKLKVKTMVCTDKLDPAIQRKQKFMSAIEDQLKVAECALKGEAYEVWRKVWAKTSKVDKC